MATVTFPAFQGGFNMLAAYFPTPEFAENVIHTPTSYIIAYGAYDYDQFTGVGFTYDVNVVPTGGTISSWVYVSGGETVFSVTGLDMPIVDFEGYRLSDPDGPDGP